MLAKKFELNASNFLNVLFFISIAGIIIVEYLSRATFVILSLWSYYEMFKSRKTLSLDRFEKAALVFSILYISSGLASYWINLPYSNHAGAKSRETYVLMLSLVPFMQLLKKYPLKKEVFILATMLLAITSGLGATIQSLFFIYSRDMLFHNRNEFVTPVLISSLLLLCILYNDRKKMRELLPAIILAVLALILAKTRASWGIFIFISGLLTLRLSHSFRARITALCAFFLIVGGIASVPSVQQRALKAYNQYRQYPHHKNTSIGHRLEMHDIGMTYFKEHPIMGIGPGRLGDHAFTEPLKQSKKFLPQAFEHHHFHNQYIELLATRGAVGFTIFICFLGILFVKFFKLSRRQPEDQRTFAVCGLVVILTYTLMGISNSPFEFKFLTMYFVLNIAALYQYATQRQVD